MYYTYIIIIPFKILRAIDSLLLVGLVTQEQAAVHNFALDLQSKKERGREREAILDAYYERISKIPLAFLAWYIELSA